MDNNKLYELLNNIDNDEQSSTYLQTIEPRDKYKLRKIKKQCGGINMNATTTNVPYNKPEHKGKPEPMPYINLQVYQQQKPRPTAPPMPPPSIPQQPIYNVLPNNTIIPTVLNSNVTNYIEIPEQNPHNIATLANPYIEALTPFSKLSSVIENIKDRQTMSKYIKDTLLYGSDGIDATHSKGSLDSILKIIKSKTVNPYKTQHTGDSFNPYKNIPPNFLIYQSCFPIKLTAQGVQCHTNSTELNIRLYRLNISESNQNISNSLGTSKVWQEIKLYEYIKNNIILTKECPNFSMIHGYNKCNDKTIRFDVVNTFNKNDKFNNQPIRKYIDISEQNYKNIIRDMMTYYTARNINFENIFRAHYDRFVSQYVNQYYRSAILDDIEIDNNFIIEMLKSFIKTHDELNSYLKTKYPHEYDNNRFNGDMLIALTESATCTLYKWASNLYENHGPIKVMTYTGSHSYEEWLSLFFQILVAFHSLIKHNIYIPNFNLENNILLKKTTNVPTNPKVWKYTVDHIEYYVPNFGAFIMVDGSFNYDDVKILNYDSNIGTIRLDNINFELIDSYNYDKLRQLLEDANPQFNISKQEFSTKTNNQMIEMLIECLNPIHFKTEDFLNHNGVPMNADAENVLNQIYSECKQYKDNNNNYNRNIFIDIINHHFKEFLNNRNGTILSIEEYNVISGLQLDCFDEHKVKKGDFILSLENGQYKIYQFYSTDNIDKLKQIPEVQHGGQDPTLLKLQNIIQEMIDEDDNNDTVDNDSDNPRDGEVIISSGLINVLTCENSLFKSIDISHVFILPSNLSVKQIITYVNGSRKPEDIMDNYEINRIQ